jgi:hypothetical protein
VENGHVLFYRRGTGAVAVSSGLSVTGISTLRSDGPGTMASDWTHLVTAPGVGILCYDRRSGVAAVEQVAADGSGAHATVASWGPGHFSAGWTHIENDGPLFFYNGTTGSGAIVLSKYT